MLSGSWVSILSRVLLTRTNAIRPDWAHMWWTGYWGVYATFCLANMGRSFSRSVLINTVVPAWTHVRRQKGNHEFQSIFIFTITTTKIPVCWLSHIGREWMSFFFRSRQQTAEKFSECLVLTADLYTHSLEPSMSGRLNDLACSQKIGEFCIVSRGKRRKKVVVYL